MKKNTGVFEPPELNPSEPLYTFTTVFCEACLQEHRVRLPYTKIPTSIEKVSFICPIKFTSLEISEFPNAWTPKEEKNEEFVEGTIVLIKN